MDQMILFSGYSMIPLAPSLISSGTMRRTSFSDMMLSMESQSELYRCDTVGFFRLGSTLAMALILSAGAFIFNPTIPSAASDDLSRVAIWSILARFQGSAQAALLAISTGTDSISSQTIRSPLALIVEPVSVTSTMASHRPSTTLASVAPQENSTVTGMLRSAK